jgi:hypothetical protein
VAQSIPFADVFDGNYRFRHRGDLMVRSTMISSSIKSDLGGRRNGS